MLNDPYQEICRSAYDDASCLANDLRDPRHFGKSVEWIAADQADGHGLAGEAKQIYINHFQQVWNEEKRPYRSIR